MSVFGSRGKRALWFVCGGAVLAACALERPSLDAHTALTLPPEFAAPREASTRVLGEAWWRTIDEARLEPLVREALLGNRTLRATLERVEAAAASARAVDAARVPHLDASLDAARARQNIIGVIPGQPLLTSQSTSFGIGASVSWEVDLWGRLAALSEAEAQRLAAAEWDLEGAAQALVGSTVKAWLAAVESEAQLELARRAAEERADWLAVAQRRFADGRAAALDVELARSEELTARDGVVVAQERVERARRTLEILLGRHPSGTLATGSVLPGVPEPVHAGLPAELLDRRPDLRAARARIEAQSSAAVAARADRYPRIALTASGGTRSNELSDLLDGDFRVWSVAGNVLAPIFDGGRLRARVDVQDALFRAAAEDFAAAVLAACGEVETLLVVEELLRTREALLVEALAAARAAEQSASDGYRAGSVDVATLLLARRGALAVEAQRIAIRATRLATRVDLCLALGGTLAAAPLAPNISPDSEDRQP